jgi:hypothetical protein
MMGSTSLLPRAAAATTSARNDAGPADRHRRLLEEQGRQRAAALNCYLEPQLDQDKTPIAVYGSPGLVKVLDEGALAYRGGITVGDLLYSRAATSSRR